MILLVSTPLGLKEALELAKASPCSVWCGSEAISEDEFRELNEPKLSRLHYPISVSDHDAIADAISTIEEHHPSQRIWIEANIDPPPD